MEILVCAGEAAEVAAITDAGTGDEKAHVGRLRSRGLRRKDSERGRRQTETRARNNLGENGHGLLRFDLSLFEAALNSQRSTRNGGRYSSVRCKTGRVNRKCSTQH